MTNRYYLYSIGYTTLLSKFREYFNTDDITTRDLIDVLDNTINGQKILKSYIIKKFNNEFELIELKNIFSN